MYYVYILKSKQFKKNLYTGFTTNLDQRLKYHNAEKVPHAELESSILTCEWGEISRTEPERRDIPA